MKRKIFNLVLIILAAFIFSPVIGHAQTENEYLVWVGDIQITDANKNDVLGDIDGEKATVIFTPAVGEKEAKLTLNDAVIYVGRYDSMRGTISAIQSDIDIIIEIKGNNILGKYDGEEVGAERYPEKYSVDYGILADRKNINFIGDGNLSIVDRADGIKAKDVTFDENFGSLNIYDDGQGVLPPCAISSEGIVTINGGEFDLTSFRENGITANKVYINDGLIKIKADSYKKAILTFEGITINENMEVINANHIEDEIDAYVVADTEIDDGYVTIEKAKYIVSFNSNGGSIVSSQNIMKNNKATKPTNPSKENYIFDGWYIDEQLSKQFDFNKEITEDITLYAKWREVESFTYKFINGDNQELIIGNIKSFVLKVDGDYSLFENLKIGDLELIKDEDYEVTEGSTIITFTDAGLAKLNTLSKGEYEMLVKYSNGEEIKGKLIMNNLDNQKIEENPKTGDNIVSYSIVGSISLIGLLGCGLYLNRKRFN